MANAFSIPADFKDYRGSGQAVLAIDAQGNPVAAVYYDDLMLERHIKSRLEAAHPLCTTAAGIMSCYEFSAFEDFRRDR